MGYTGMRGLDATDALPLSVLGEYGFLCRYIALGGEWKHATTAELHGYVAAGKHVVLNGESFGGSQGVRDVHSFARGVDDAQRCDKAARELGYPGAPIFFSVDYDEPPADAPEVNSYFQGINSVIGVERTGCYGSYYVLNRRFEAGLITYGWQTYAWSGSMRSDRAHIMQYSNGHMLAGHGVDYNRILPAGDAYFGCACCYGKQEDDMDATQDRMLRELHQQMISQTAYDKTGDWSGWPEWNFGADQDNPVGEDGKRHPRQHTTLDFIRKIGRETTAFFDSSNRGVTSRPVDTMLGHTMNARADIAALSKQVAGLQTAITELAAAKSIDAAVADEIVAKVKAAIENVTVHLDVADGGAA